MAPRRSARIQTQDAVATSSVPAPDVKETPIVKFATGQKRKAPAIKVDKAAANIKRSATGAAVSKTKTKTRPKSLPPGAQSCPNGGGLSSMPPEVLNMILDNITEPSTIGRLGRTCKKYHTLMTPRLHKRIAIAVPFHAHIRKAIRVLEPHLSVAQKKQLRKEGKYLGQQERYPPGAGAKLKPACASYVRQMIVGKVDPGQRHEYIVFRYLEEAFKNFNSLEVVDTNVLTKQMAQSLASLESLQALHICTDKTEPGAVECLKNIRNLKHLKIEDYAWESSGTPHGGAIRSMMANSMSTLLSLTLEAAYFDIDSLFSLSNESASSVEPSADQAHSLTALRSLTLAQLQFNDASIRALLKMVDFTALRDLSIGALFDGSVSLFERLASIFSSGKLDKVVKLRSLYIDMSSIRFQDTFEHRMEVMEKKFHLINSLDTLTSLHIKCYNEYPSDINVNPGLPEPMLQAILKNKNLRTLKISYSGVSSAIKIPYLSAETVGRIVDGLPLLEEFEFAPEEADMVDIGHALSRAANLTTLSCFPYDSWVDGTEIDGGELVLSKLLKGIMSGSTRAGGGSGKPAWEEYSNLRRVRLSDWTWEVASKFGKSPKRVKKPIKLTSDAGNDDKREVMYRDISRFADGDMYGAYASQYEWVDAVARDVD